MKQLLATITGTLITILIGVSGLVTFAGGGQAVQNDGLDTAMYPPTAIQAAAASEQEEQRDEAIAQAGVPKNLSVPAIDVNAQIEQVGVTPKGAMQHPSSWVTVGWYKLGTRPGNVGNAVIAGHVDSDIGPAVFWNLKKLSIGDAIIITDDEGEEWIYEVERLESYPLNDVPMQELFGHASKAQLVLVTCQGEWIEHQGYDERLVVFATLVSNEVNQ